MNESEKIREQIKHMRQKGIEPEVIYMRRDFWESLGKPWKYLGIRCYESDDILVKFEIR